MAEYIDRDAIYTAFANACTDVLERASEIDYIAGFSDELVIEILDNIPTVDVAPVVHSYWESYDCSQYMGTDEYGEPKWRDGKFYVCHNHRCRRKTVVKSHYCPNCGAKMDGGANNG